MPEKLQKAACKNGLEHSAKASMSSTPTEPKTVGTAPANTQRTRTRRRLQVLSLALQALLTAVGLVGFARDWLAHRPLRHVDWVETIAGTLGFALTAWSASHPRASVPRFPEGKTIVQTQESSQPPPNEPASTEDIR